MRVLVGLLALVAILLCGCRQESSASKRYRLSIEGVRPGMDLDAVRSILGEETRVETTSQGEVRRDFESERFAILCFSDANSDTIGTVMGFSLTVSGADGHSKEFLLGDKLESLSQTLGEPDEVRSKSSDYRCTFAEGDCTLEVAAGSVEFYQLFGAPIWRRGRRLNSFVLEEVAGRREEFPEQ